MELMMQLAELGFPPERIQRALKATKCKGLDTALDYLQNEFDPPESKDSVTAIADDDEESKDPVSTALKQSQRPSAEEPSSSSIPQKVTSVDELQQKVAEKRKSDALKEEQEMKEQELKRRQEGKELLALKSQRDAIERQNMLEERKKQMEDERRRKERVLAMIAEDRATQNQPSVAKKAEPKPEILSKPANSDNVRIAIRGVALEKQLLMNLSPDCTLDDVVAHIEEQQPNIMTRHRLIIPLPHHEFGLEDYSKSLLDLGLAPSVILTLAPKLPN